MFLQKATDPSRTSPQHKTFKTQSISSFQRQKTKPNLSSSTPSKSSKSIKILMESLLKPMPMKFKELLLTLPLLGMFHHGLSQIFQKSLSKAHLVSTLFTPVKTILKLSSISLSSMKVSSFSII